MTAPDQQQTDPPTQHQPPVGEPPPQRPQVVLPPSQPDTGLVNLMRELGQTIAGLPERTANAIREAQPNLYPQQPQDGTQPQQQPAQPLSQQQQPTAEGKLEQVAPTRRPGKVAAWFFGMGKQ